MSEIGSIIDEYSDAFEEYHYSTVELRNFVAGELDARRDPSKELDVEASAQVEAQIVQNSTPEQVVAPTGETHVVDAEIHLDDRHVVSDGTDDRAYPTEFREPDGNTWVVVSTFDEGNGSVRCDATNAGREGVS